MRWNQYATKDEALADQSGRQGIPVTGQHRSAGPAGTSGTQWCIVPGEAPRRFHLVRRRAGTDLYYEAANDEWGAR
jgi:hypothetical protein